MTALYREQSAAFRCSVSPELSRARVKIGWSSYNACVTEVSRDGFTLSLPDKVAKRVPQGTEFQLDYRGERWILQSEYRNQDSDGNALVSAVCTKDLTKMNYRDGSIRESLFGGVKISPTDPVLPIGVVAGIILILLISPGWGDQLGTSSYLTDMIRQIIDGFKEAVSS